MQKISETELSLMTRLWDRGPATIGQLTDTLYGTRTDAQYATVQKLLDRLETKDFVRRDRASRAHTFHALISRDDFLGFRLHELADRLCSGSITPLVTNLASGHRLSRADVESLKEFVAGLEGKEKGDTS